MSWLRRRLFAWLPACPTSSHLHRTLLNNVPFQKVGGLHRTTRYIPVIIIFCVSTSKRLAIRPPHLPHPPRSSWKRHGRKHKVVIVMAPPADSHPP
ncbi:hypothetical protein GGR52DRAFT_299286 [Hypoxylon sp. FL1284]|nr:hypothetical protein GGR52DRAFT_299286 [Hypoxylon sp. FL1284]